MFIDRLDAGRRLAEAVSPVPSDTVILGIPRGGVVVARAMADVLERSFDVIVVRKLGAPHNPELAIGAIGPDGSVSLAEEVVRALPALPEDYIEREAELQRREIERRMRLYRGDRPFPVVRDRACLLVDDGIATGSTARAALRWLRGQGASPLILAVPVAPAATAEELEREADRVVCLYAPADFFAVGQWYQRFDQIGDDQVIEALEGARTVS